VGTTKIDGTTQPRVRQRQRETDSLIKAKRNEIEREGDNEREKEETIRMREKGRSTGERDSTCMREIESDRESERRNKERKRRIDLRRSAPNNDSRPRSVAREPRSREHLSVSLVLPREIPRLLRFANRVPELNWYAIHRKKKKKVRVNRYDKKIQSIREGIFDDQGLSLEIKSHEVEQEAEFTKSSTIPCEQESKKDGENSDDP